MTSKLCLKILKSCFKLFFLTKKFKEMKQDYILKTFINVRTKNIKIQNIRDIIEISKSIEPNKCTY
jgi:hypothetical protein